MFRNLKHFTIVVLAFALLSTVAASALAAPTYQADQNIVETAVADGRFTTLVTALQEAELVETLEGEGPFTVFAPTDEAFEALPEGVLEALLADVPALTDVLLYHVVPGEVMAADVVNLDSADTVLGEPLTVTANDGNVMINDANVIITDIETSNGVIHVVDAVLVPEGVAASLESDSMEAEEPMAEGEAMEEEAAEETTMEESSAAAESESPEGLPSTGGSLTTTSFVIVGLVLVGMILALGGLALRVGIGMIK